MDKLVIIHDYNDHCTEAHAVGRIKGFKTVAGHTGLAVQVGVLFPPWFPPRPQPATHVLYLLNPYSPPPPANQQITAVAQSCLDKAVVPADIAPAKTTLKWSQVMASGQDVYCQPGRIALRTSTNLARWPH